jgi:hypothetical protein
MAEAIALAACFATLALAFGVFVLPLLGRSNRSLLGAAVSIAAVLSMADAGVVAWAILAATLGLFLVGSATPRMEENAQSGWHNWFVIVVTASSLWLLSLFLLWTLEEALSQPVDTLSVPPAVWDVVSVVFDRHLWTVGLLALLAGAVGLGAVGLGAAGLETKDA